MNLSQERIKTLEKAWRLRSIILVRTNIAYLFEFQVCVVFYNFIHAKASNVRFI